MTNIELGCGKNKKEGYVGIDISPNSDADHIVDLETDGLPFPNESVLQVYTSHTLEHISNLIHVMNECWRVLKWGGVMTIKVPHKDCPLAWQDPTHKRFFVPAFTKFFCGEYMAKYKHDYGIRCCFKEILNVVSYPDGRPEYFQEIEVQLLKDKEHYDSVDHDVIKQPYGDLVLIEKDPIKKAVFQERTKAFLMLCHELSEQFDRKNRDYNDGFFQTNKEGFGIDQKLSQVDFYVQLRRKMARIAEFASKRLAGVEVDPKVLDETEEDTIKDIAIYCVMELMKRRMDGPEEV